MISGTCHCGTVEWRIDALVGRVTACSCTICRRYAALWAYGYFGETIHTKGETQTYRRAEDGDIDFHFCPSCGCLTHYVGTKPDDDGRLLSAVNARMAEPAAVADLNLRRFDGFETWSNLPSEGDTVKDLLV